MPNSELSLQVDQTLDRFAWEEWAQMGVLATAGPPRSWAQDPEALLLFSFEVGRSDPRLFDEVLDWLITNEPLISLRRLRSLAVDPEDKALVDAVVAWLGQQRPKARFAQPTPEPSEVMLPLFYQERFPTAHPDPVFARYGWLRSAFTGTRKSMPPTIDAPINLSFRLRMLFGLNARAEIARVLFTIEEPAVTSATLARATGFTKRNVHEALAAFELAGVVASSGSGYELRYRLDHDRWAEFLEVSEPIEYVDWIPILLSLRRIQRWLRGSDRPDASAYIVASSARDLLERLRPDLRAADIEVPSRRRAESALDDLQSVLNQIFELLDLN